MQYPRKELKISLNVAGKNWEKDWSELEGGKMMDDDRVNVVRLPADVKPR